MRDIHTNTQISLSADMLQIKLSNLRGYYSRELNKVKKSRRSGASSEDVYKSQWVHFAFLDSFLKAQVTPRASQSNIVSICIRNLSHVPLPWYLALTVKIVTKFISYSLASEEALFPPC